MKRGLKTFMHVEFANMDFDHIAQVEFLFQQYKDGGAQKSFTWEADNPEQSDLRSGNTILVPWERAETYKFSEGKGFWMDVRPTTDLGYDIDIPIVQLQMNPSLFAADPIENSQEVEE